MNGNVIEIRDNDSSVIEIIKSPEKQPVQYVSPTPKPYKCDDTTKPPEDKNVVEVSGTDSKIISIVDITKLEPIQYNTPNENTYTCEKIINKVQTLDNPNSYTYPSTKAVYEFISTELWETRDKTYSYYQNTISDTWIINHNLDKYPSVTVTDSAGSAYVGDVHYVDKNNIIIYFSVGFTGRADLN